MQLVSTNAAQLVTVPKPRGRPIVPLTVDQATAFLTVASTHRLYALFAVALACGLRLGEACGLRWEDIDLGTGDIRIRQQLQKVGSHLELQPLKTAKSRRTLMLPDVCLHALQTHRTTQLAARLQAGEDWVETGLVFTTYRHRPGATVGTGATSAQRVADVAPAARRRRSPDAPHALS